MPISELENFYLKQPEPNQSCFLALKDVILDVDPNITTAFKYKLPFFMFRNKMFCYLWMEKTTKTPYIGIVKGDKINHPKLIQGNRKKMKILPVDPNKDIEVELIHKILKEALKLY